jgi:hypothetical protein
MRLFEKAKRFGVWNPSDIDLSQDQTRLAGLNAEEQDILLRCRPCSRPARRRSRWTCCR